MLTALYFLEFKYSKTVFLSLISKRCFNFNVLLFTDNYFSTNISYRNPLLVWLNRISCFVFNILYMDNGTVCILFDHIIFVVVGRWVGSSIEADGLKKMSVNCRCEFEISCICAKRRFCRCFLFIFIVCVLLDVS